jgi:hypothetical protein
MCFLEAVEFSRCALVSLHSLATVATRYRSKYDHSKHAEILFKQKAVECSRCALVKGSRCALVSLTKFSELCYVCYTVCLLGHSRHNIIVMEDGRSTSITLNCEIAANESSRLKERALLFRMSRCLILIVLQTF